VTDRPCSQDGPHLLDHKATRGKTHEDEFDAQPAKLREAKTGLQEDRNVVSRTKELPLARILPRFFQTKRFVIFTSR